MRDGYARPLCDPLHTAPPVTPGDRDSCPYPARAWMWKRTSRHSPEVSSDAKSTRPRSSRDHSRPPASGFGLRHCDQTGTGARNRELHDPRARAAPRSHDRAAINPDRFHFDITCPDPPAGKRLDAASQEKPPGSSRWSTDGPLRTRSIKPKRDAIPSGAVSPAGGVFDEPRLQGCPAPGPCANPRG